MGKGDSRTKPKKVKNIKRALSNSVAARQHHSRPKGPGTAEDPRKPVLAARARHRGLAPDRQTMLQQTAVHLGDDVGRCIEHQASEEAPELYAVWSRFCAAEENYNRRILGQTGKPKGMKIEMMPERIETDQSHTIDTRTEEERDDAAKKAHQTWNGYVKDIASLEYQSILHQARSGHVQCWAGTSPLARGMVLVSAIRALKEASS